MRYFSNLVTSLVILFSAGSAVADDHLQVPEYGGVETFACSFNEGKDMDDLLKVTKKWDKWFDKNSTVGYTGLVLTPYYYDALEADVYWVGFSSSLEDQAVAQTEFLATDLSADFYDVYTCESHAQLAWVRIRDEVGPSADGVVDFSACAMLPGATQQALSTADEKMNAFLTEIGSTARIYRWYPMQGGEANGADFYQAGWSSSLQEKGANADKFVRAGGPLVETSLYGELLSCNNGPSATYLEVGGGNVE